MFVKVDANDGQTVEGFVFTNRNGEDEYVKYSHSGAVEIVDQDGCNSYVYIEDVPKLIKALQAAHDHINKK